jgi:hypothetical protein
VRGTQLSDEYGTFDLGLALGESVLELARDQYHARRSGCFQLFPAGDGRGAQRKQGLRVLDYGSRLARTAPGGDGHPRRHVG